MEEDEHAGNMEGMQDVLKAAAGIKTTQLKLRPGRQDWERAPDWIKYTSWPETDILALRQGCLGTRLARCEELKEQGNKLYEQDMAAAIQVYSEALSLWVWFDRGRDRASEDIPWVNSVDALPEGPDKEHVKEVVVALFNNSASCLIKMNQPESVVYAASKALEYDPYNVKSLYRRAHGHYHSGTSSGLEKAVKDLKEAQALEPGNAQVHATLVEYSRELLLQNKKDAAVFGNMFKRGELYTAHELEVMRQEAQAAKQAAAQQEIGADEEESRRAKEEDDPPLLGRNKAKDPSPMAMQQALRQMQRGVTRAGARLEADKEKAPAKGVLIGLLPQLPWWVWAIILFHLVWRIQKLWNISIPGLTFMSSSGGAGESAEHEL